MKISANGYIALIFIVGMIVAGWIFATAPDTAPQQLPYIGGFALAVITIIAQQGATAAAAAKAKEAAEHSIEVSQHNAVQLAEANKRVAVIGETVVAVQQDVANNTEVTEYANQQIRELKVTVDGRLGQLLERTAIAARLTGAQEERDRPTDAPEESRQ